MDYMLVQDIHTGDKTLRDSFYNYYKAGDPTSAQAVYTNNESQLKTKCMNANNMNDIRTSILSTENGFNTNVNAYLESKTDLFDDTVDSIEFVGTYISGEQYYKNNIVLYNDSLYYCKTNTTSLPTTNNWLELGLKGETGYPTLGISYEGIWQQNVEYNIYDMVIYSNIPYVSKTTQTGVVPSSSSNWLKVEGDKNKIYVGSTLVEGYSMIFKEV